MESRGREVVFSHSYRVFSLFSLWGEAESKCSRGCSSRLVQTSLPRVLGGGAQAQPVTPIFLGFPGAVKIKTPLNRELVATYEVTISVHDNASEVIDRSVSVPNGKHGLLPGSAGLGLVATRGWHSLSQAPAQLLGSQQLSHLHLHPDQQHFQWEQSWSNSQQVRVLL